MDFVLLYTYSPFILENSCNKSTITSIHFTVLVFDCFECHCYPMVCAIIIAHMRCLLFGAEILSLFIEVIHISDSDFHVTWPVPASKRKMAGEKVACFD